jgi:mannose-1-phosphate guanylyltransferase
MRRMCLDPAGDGVAGQSPSFREIGSSRAVPAVAAPLQLPPSVDDLLNRPSRERWGLILAGGQGLRLRGLTRAIAGDERPKQFCAIETGETLLERTRRRAALIVPPARILVSLTRTHEPFYRPLLGGMPAHCAIVQPEDRGTTPAILYGAMRIAAVAPLGTVAIFPSDHYVSDDHVFMRHVAVACDAVDTRPDLLVLLGITPDTAESESGWIESAEAIPSTPLLRVRRFWEKPPQALADLLFARRCYWNSLVLVARVPTLLALVRDTAPGLYGAFAARIGTLGTQVEQAELRKLYAGLSPSNFSDAVLVSRPSNLAVLPVSGVQWGDWGHPARVMATLNRMGVHPDWLDRLAPTG